MKTLSLTLATTIIALAVALLALDAPQPAGATQFEPVAASAHHAPPRESRVGVVEGDEGWRCAAMGNGLCGPWVMVDPEVVSEAFNDRLAGAGYDDATRPVLRSHAIELCITDTDCAYVAGEVMP
jgi:hypothetical protein